MHPVPHPLARGTYVLTRSVPNPHPRQDRRDWRCLPVWEEGSRFFCDLLGTPPRLALWRASSPSFEAYPLTHPDLAELLEALELLAEKPSEYLERRDTSALAPAILDHLLSTGHLGWPHLKAAEDFLLHQHQDAPPVARSIRPRSDIDTPPPPFLDVLPVPPPRLCP